MRSKMIGLGVVAVVGIVALFLEFGMKGRAQFESSFVYHGPLGGVSTSGMVYKNGMMPKRGWGGTTQSGSGVAGGSVEYRFTFLRHRNGRDVYRVVRSFRKAGGSVQTAAVDIAYEGREVVLFDDELGKALLSPRLRPQDPR